MIKFPTNARIVKVVIIVTEVKIVAELKTAKEVKIVKKSENSFKKWLEAISHDVSPVAMFYPIIGFRMFRMLLMEPQGFGELLFSELAARKKCLGIWLSIWALIYLWIVSFKFFFDIWSLVLIVTCKSDRPCLGSPTSIAASCHPHLPGNQCWFFQICIISEKPQMAQEFLCGTCHGST